MERVLKAVPVDLRIKMEALVHDLTVALEESSNSTNHRRRWPLRRRTRSTGNIRKSSLSATKHSDDSSSSICDIKKPVAVMKYQSDSDDTNRTKRFARFSNLNNISNIESDSVNENFIPRTNTKRKRKFKKMAIDSDSNLSNPSSSQTLTTTIITNSIGKKKRLYRTNCETRYGTIWCGKRKRSCREKSIDNDLTNIKTSSSPLPTTTSSSTTKTSSSRQSKNKNRVKIQNQDAMDCSIISNSSISSSDTDDGIITNDEDREGDDEQSDWFVESSWWDDESGTDEKITNDQTFQAILHNSFEHLTDDARRNYRQRLQWSRDGREIRAGRRHVDNKPGFSIITSANEKVSRFLQDPSQSELRLHAMRQPEREKLRRLATLYSLNLKGDLNCPVLYKTRHTTQAICVDQVSLNRLTDYKRLRKTPPFTNNFTDSSGSNLQSTRFTAHMANQTQGTTIGSMQNLVEPMTFDWCNMESDNSRIKFDGNMGHSKSS